MKIAFITDTHFGCRSDDQTFASFFKKFYEEYFFPYLKNNNINTIIHLGDIMDRRKYVNYLTAKNLRQVFLEPCVENNINTHIIIGNHDTFYKNTNDYNSMQELAQAYKNNISWYSECTHISIDGKKIALVPWINSGNYDNSINFIKNSDAEILLGHLELQGFGMYKGIINEHGMDSSIFNKFSFVASGHFHHKSSKGNIHYLGAPYEITWSDFADDRGFHIFDTNDFNLEFIKNPFNMFEKIFYDDSSFSETDFDDMDFSHLKNKMVKIVEVNKNNPYLFDKIVDKIEKIGVNELQTVIDHQHQDIIEDEEIIDEISDTLSIIHEYVDGNNFKNSNEIKKIFDEIYSEALQK